MYTITIDFVSNNTEPDLVIKWCKEQFGPNYADLDSAVFDRTYDWFYQKNFGGSSYYSISIIVEDKHSSILKLKWL